MDSKEFRTRGREMIDYVANYLESIEKLRVTPSIEPGYLKELIPLEAPESPESWTDIMKDVEEKIMIGMTHWQHPRFHAYFPSGNSYPSILADILSDTIGCIGFSWAAGPACTELETIVLDWFGKMMALPDKFLSCTEGGKGGGVIQASASECVLVALLAARAQAIKKLKKADPNGDEGVMLSKLMAYCSKEAHSCLEKGAMIAFVKLRILEPDENFSLQGSTLRNAMEEDKKNGLFPFFVSTTIGTTSCCSVDNLKDIGPICQEFDVWLHCDMAYAGSAMICPEMRHLFAGIEYANSLNTNTNKWLLVNFDCSCMWVSNRYKLTQALVVDPLYLQHSYSEKCIDYRHWGIPLSRRFRALKMWFVIRSYGVEGLREYIRNHCRLAKVFEALVRKDSRFEVMNKVYMGLVCFRLKGSNGLNQKLLSTINASGKLHMVPASLNDKYVIRFCVCREQAVEADMHYAWDVIREFAESVSDLHAEEAGVSQEIREKEDEEDDESKEKVTELLKEKNEKSIKEKRSFFVRMVSDPKLYNPKIVKARIPTVKAIKGSPTSPSRKQNGLNNGVNNYSSSSIPTQHSSPLASWISWPLAFMLQEVFDEVSNSEVPLRFRNWESTLTIKPGQGAVSGAEPNSQNQNFLSPDSSSCQKSPERNRKNGKEVVAKLPPPRSPTAFLQPKNKNNQNN